MWLKDRLRLSDEAKALLKKVFINEIYGEKDININQNKKLIREILGNVALECASDEMELIGQRIKYDENGKPFKFCLNCQKPRNICECKRR